MIENALASSLALTNEPSACLLVASSMMGRAEMNRFSPRPGEESSHWSLVNDSKAASWRIMPQKKRRVIAVPMAKIPAFEERGNGGARYDVTVVQDGFSFSPKACVRGVRIVLDQRHSRLSQPWAFALKWPQRYRCVAQDRP